MGHKSPDFCSVRKISRCHLYNSAKKFPVDFPRSIFRQHQFKRCNDTCTQVSGILMAMSACLFGNENSLLFQNLNGKRCWKLWTLRAREYLNRWMYNCRHTLAQQTFPNWNCRWLTRPKYLSDTAALFWSRSKIWHLTILCQAELSPPYPPSPSPAGWEAEWQSRPLHGAWSPRAGVQNGRAWCGGSPPPSWSRSWCTTATSPSSLATLRPAEWRVRPRLEARGV